MTSSKLLERLQSNFEEDMSDFKALVLRSLDRYRVYEMVVVQKKESGGLRK
jgi:hypothetical protein